MIRIGSNRPNLVNEPSSGLLSPGRLVIPSAEVRKLFQGQLHRCRRELFDKRAHLVMMFCLRRKDSNVYQQRVPLKELAYLVARRC